jgi:hypothetical protein
MKKKFNPFTGQLDYIGDGGGATEVLSLSLNNLDTYNVPVGYKLRSIIIEGGGTIQIGRTPSGNDIMLLATAEGQVVHLDEIVGGDTINFTITGIVNATLIFTQLATDVTNLSIINNLYDTGAIIFGGITGAAITDKVNLFFDDVKNWLGIGTDSPRAALDVQSTVSGILIPRMTEVQRDAIIDPQETELIFNVTADEFQFYCIHDLRWNGLAGTFSGSITYPKEVEMVLSEITHNLVIPDGTNTVFLSNTTPTDITGIVGNGSHQQIAFHNRGSSNFSWKSEDTGSDVGNRLIIPTNFTHAPNTTVTFRESTILNGWFPISQY